MNPDFKILFELAKIIQHSLKKDEDPINLSVEILRAGTAFDKTLKPGSFGKLKKAYMKFRESLIIDGKPFNTLLSKFTHDYNEFPNIKKLAEELETINPKVDLDESGNIKPLDPLGLVTEELEAKQALGCGDPKCTQDHTNDPMFFSPSCHRGAPLSVSYFRGSLELSCSICGKDLAKIKVASTVDE
jgi:hypothetical protein